MPTNLTTTALSNPTRVALTWSASSDNVGVKAYWVYRTGRGQVATVTGTSFTDPDVAPGTSYGYAVRAVDAAGNVSDYSTIVYVTTAGGTSDTSAPTAPSWLTTKSTTQTSITLTWAASTDDVGVAGYGVYRDGAKRGDVTTLEATFTNLLCGTTYTLGVDAFDAAGNRSNVSRIYATTSACASAAEAA